MCGEVPMPGEPELRPPFFARLALSTSSSVRIGLLVGTTSNSGLTPSIAIGVNDLTMS